MPVLIAQLRARVGPFRWGRTGGIQLAERTDPARQNARPDRTQNIGLHAKKGVRVRFGTPLRLGRRDANDRAYLRDATDALMNDIATLCGQQYVDRDAPLIDA
jgi:hypothetical protein